MELLLIHEILIYIGAFSLVFTVGNFVKKIVGDRY